MPRWEKIGDRPISLIGLDKRVPADTSKKMEEVRPMLEQEIMAKKTNQEFQNYFVQLRAQANPQNMMTPEKPTQADRERDVLELLKEGQAPMPGSLPSGN